MLPANEIAITDEDGVYIITVTGPDPTAPTVNISKKL
jgi:hypothetical protein